MEYLTATHLLGGSYVGTVSGSGLTLVPGKLGKALSLGNNNAFLDLGQLRDNCFGMPDLCSNGYSITMWLNRQDVLSGESYYFCSGGQTGASYGISIHGKTGSQLQFDIKTKTNWYRLTKVISTNTWHHIGFTWSEATLLKAYVDGQYVGQSTKQAYSRSSTSLNNFYIGKPNNANKFYGKAILDEILFWDSPKDDAFFQAVYDSYSDPFKLHFVSATDFHVRKDTAFNTAATEIGKCVKVHVGRSSVHPCRSVCMWLIWCGSVVYNGHECIYYNIYETSTDLTYTSSGSTMFVKVI